MKAMEKAKMVKFKEGLKAKAAKPSATITAKNFQPGDMPTVRTGQIGGDIGTVSQTPLGGIVATTPAELIAQERKKSLEGIVELGPTETEYSPVKKYLMKRGSK